MRIVELMEEKKGESIKILSVSKLTWITDYFVIVSGNSAVHTKALAETLINGLEERPVAVEGMQESKWILIDYDEIIIHIFMPETRDYYKLEKLWSDADDIVYNSKAENL